MAHYQKFQVWSINHWNLSTISVNSFHKKVQLKFNWIYSPSPFFFGWMFWVRDADNARLLPKPLRNDWAPPPFSLASCRHARPPRPWTPTSLGFQGLTSQQTRKFHLRIGANDLWQMTPGDPPPGNPGDKPPSPGGLKRSLIIFMLKTNPGVEKKTALH